MGSSTKSKAREGSRLCVGLSFAVFVAAAVISASSTQRNQTRSEKSHVTPLQQTRLSLDVALVVEPPAALSTSAYAIVAAPTPLPSLHNQQGQHGTNAGVDPRPVSVPAANPTPAPFNRTPQGIPIDAMQEMHAVQAGRRPITSLVGDGSSAIVIGVARPTPAPCNPTPQGIPIDAMQEMEAVQAGTSPTTSLVEPEFPGAAVARPTPAPYNPTPQGIPIDAMQEMEAARAGTSPTTSLVEPEFPGAAVARPTPAPYNPTPQGIPIDAMQEMEAARAGTSPTTSLVEGEFAAAAVAAVTPTPVAHVDCPAPAPAVTPCPESIAAGVLRAARHGPGNPAATPGALSMGVEGPAPSQPTPNPHGTYPPSSPGHITFGRGSSGVHHSEL